MTQTTGTGSIFAVDLRVSHADVDELGFGSLVGQVQDLRSLVTLAHLLRDGPLRKPFTGDVPRGTFEQAQMRAEQLTTIKSLSYNSPLEICLTLLGGTGTALAIANRILSLHDRFQKSRLLRSNVDLRVAANDAIRSEIHSRGGALNELPKELRDTIRGASRALSQITAVEIDPQSQPD